jgi:putative hydrolase of the HAD superfamily
MNTVNDIFFDLDNTLWDFKKSSNLALKETFSSFGLIAEFKNYLIFHKIYSHHNQRMWSMYYNNAISRKDLMVNRFKATIKERGIIDDELTEDMNRMYMNLCHKYTSLFPNTLETLQYLVQKNYRCHAISNGFGEVQYKKIELCGLTDYLDTITCSEDLGICKPHKGIFQHALSKAGAELESSIMVGDDVNTDIKGALNFGLRAFHLSLTKSEISISCISELRNIL